MWWHRKPTGAGNSSAAGDEKAMSSVNFYTIHPGVDIDSLTFRWLSTQRKKVLSLPQNRGPEAASASSSRATEDSAAEITSTALVNSSKIFGPANQIAGLPTVNYPMAATTTEHEDSSYLTPTSDVSTEEASAIVSQAGPQFLPSQFGFQTNMEGSWDRRFWDFYTKNWCPGRTIIEKTNLWLNDFARMQENDGVLAAIQALAGVYIHDYMPMTRVCRKVNECFQAAESRLTELINYPTELDGNLSDELITIATLLSMEDIILIERRLKKPLYPRWLIGFLQAEAYLRATDPGTRFWHATNVQLSSLRISQCVIVGCAIILAQPMMPLVEPRDFKPQKEAMRFDWLLSGTEPEMFEIHGGCGFSRRLLHAFSQITYCAARMHQEPESPITPMTAQFLLRQLETMRQWSSESSSWTDAQNAPQPIEWIRKAPEGFRVQDHQSMTTVTAEAWRVAAVIYLQCRALRLPRNHSDVLSKLKDLGHCVRIMPSYGTLFTARAPIFPIFLLGMIGSTPHSRSLCQGWFEDVIGTPVRSSVPPLFNVLLGVWDWIDEVMPVDDEEPPSNVTLRAPWWEELVSYVQMSESERICLTPMPFFLINYITSI